MLPFTQQQFLAVFSDYNEAIWPSQIVAYLLGGTAFLLLFRQTARSSRAIAVVLSAMWIWTGVLYHGIWFSQINKSAYLFALLFVIEGGGLILAGAYGHQLRFGFRRGAAAWIGASLVGYSAIVYPLIGMATGHDYPAVPVFGVTPCPVAIFTFGMLLLTIGPVPHWLLVVPVIWSLIGGSAAILLAVPQDWLLLVSGLVAAPLIAIRRVDVQTAST
ncbi:DUF6064 family protein [Bradyrhizobium sp. LVM 105]|uniref:DUF6064 family protein n=1 Tax=Bradyrhizobium sp. LVM 105 TaxID=2341115 RepID=UPI000F802496|nr:DUF6064 family protein [Bradyrhizobium sp. LVM 105]RTE91646.1 hypothetical protein D6B98_19775 [Bradyrhizobium sp. LVM 105]